jgi:hypothetical protein
LKKVRRTPQDRSQKREIATIEGDADLKINMIELKISSICPEELEIHHWEKSPTTRTPATFTVWMAIILRSPFYCFYSL